MANKKSAIPDHPPYRIFGKDKPILIRFPSNITHKNLVKHPYDLGFNRTSTVLQPYFNRISTQPIEYGVCMVKAG